MRGWADPLHRGRSVGCRDEKGWNALEMLVSIVDFLSLPVFPPASEMMTVCSYIFLDVIGNSYPAAASLGGAATLPERHVSLLSLSVFEVEPDTLLAPGTTTLLFPLLSPRGGGGGESYGSTKGMGGKE